MNELKLKEVSLLVDAHVHFYDCFDPCTFFSSAYSNLSSSSNNKDENLVHVLLLTETVRENGFQRLTESSSDSDKAICTGNESWYCHPTGEADSVYLKTDSGKKLYVVAGRQIVVSEGLEVHALATGASFEDGLPLQDLLEEIKKKGGIAAMPWGTGKWLGRRGNVMKSMCHQFSQSGVLLSDSGIRPWVWPESNLYKSGPRVIAGTDPLPVAAEALRVGSFGFSAVAHWDPNRPAQSMRSILENQELKVSCFGSSQGVWQFFSRQISIRTQAS